MRRFRPLFARSEGDLPLLTVFKGAILTLKSPESSESVKPAP